MGEIKVQKNPQSSEEPKSNGAEQEKKPSVEKSSSTPKFEGSLLNGKTVVPKFSASQTEAAKKSSVSKSKKVSSTTSKKSKLSKTSKMSSFKVGDSKINSVKVKESPLVTSNKSTESKKTNRKSTSSLSKRKTMKSKKNSGEKDRSKEGSKSSLTAKIRALVSQVISKANHDVGDSSASKKKTSSKKGSKVDKVKKSAKKKKDLKDMREQFNSKDKAIECMGLKSCQTHDPAQALDDRQVDYSIKLIQSNLKKFEEIKASVECDSDSNFPKYVWDRSKPLEKSKPNSCISIHKAQHTDYPEAELVCKVYDTKKYDPKKSRYLKILRQISKKHPSIVGTWEVYNAKKEIVVFQEFAGYGSIVSYVEHFEALKENRAQESAKQVLRAMDYLGDFGFAHRSIQPKHLLVFHATEDWQIKLTGFNDSIIYWDVQSEKILFQNCLPLSEANSKNYQAPEIYGKPNEQFDPIVADIWSFGATIFFLVSKEYPYKSKDIQEEIKGNIKKLSLSEKGKDILTKMLSIVSSERISFEMMYKHEWLKEA